MVVNKTQMVKPDPYATIIKVFWNLVSLNLNLITALYQRMAKLIVLSFRKTVQPSLPMILSR